MKDETLKKTFERKLLYFDEAEYSRQLGDFRNNLEILNQVAESYEAIFSGKITRERLNQIFNGNYEAIKEVATQAIKKSARNQMLADVGLKLFEEKFFDFEVKVSRMVERFRKTGERQVFVCVTPLEWFSLNSEGRFILSDETLAQIKERCKNYISSPEEQEIFDLLQNVSDAINEAFEKLGPNARKNLDNNFLPRHYNVAEFLTADEEGRTQPDPQTNYQILTQ